MRELKSVKIEKIALHGYGIAYLSKRTLFIPYTAPGDVVDIKLTQERKDIAFGSVIRYVSRAKGLIEAPCEAFGPKAQCGGCDWLMAPYNTQLGWKDSLIHGVFDSIVSPEIIKPIIGSPLEYGYRNKAFFPVTSRKGRLIFGMFQSWTHNVIPHKVCKIQMPIFDRIAQRVIEIAQKAGAQAYEESKHAGNLRQIGLRSSADGSSINLIIVTKSSKLPFSQVLVKTITHEFPQISGIIQNIQRNRTNIILGDEDKILWGNPYITEKIGNLSFRVHYRSFLQVNPGTTSLILEHIKQHLGKNEQLIDAYSGIGSIGLSLADSCKKVICIEEVAAAIEDAKLNATINKINKVDFHCARVEDILAKLNPKQANSIIVDPPRSGLDENIPTIIANAAIAKVIYLSCNPMTLARDLKAFLQKGYKATLIQPFDMFPQTWHIETLAILSKI